MRTSRAHRKGLVVTALLLVVGCHRQPVSPPTYSPTPTETPTITPAPTATVARPATPTVPLREILLTAPQSGAVVDSPVHVRGRVSVMPFEGTLRGRVYDEHHRVIGEVPIQAHADVEGDLGGPGAFSGSIPFQTDTTGPGQVEIAEISVRDGSTVASATVAVTLTESVPPDPGETDLSEAGSLIRRSADRISPPALSKVDADESSPGSRRCAPLTVINSWAGQPLGDITSQPLRWSSDGRASCFASAPVSDGPAVFVKGTIHRLHSLAPRKHQ